MSNIIFLLLIIFIACIANMIFESCMCENFSMYNTYQSAFPSVPWWNGYTDLPWNNSRLGNTNNMSYDLRGDPMVIPRTQFPWNNSSLVPIYNQGI
jgi:hypothetical protein